MQKLRDLVVYQNRGEYASFNAFPNAAITRSGRMVLAFRQARDYRARHGKTVHIDPKARGVLITSEDQGATWSSPPSTMADHFLYGVQDPCLKTLRDGTLLGTYFLWKAVELGTGRRHPPSQTDLSWLGRSAGWCVYRSLDRRGAHLGRTDRIE